MHQIVEERGICGEWNTLPAPRFAIFQLFPNLAGLAADPPVCNPFSLLLSRTSPPDFRSFGKDVVASVRVNFVLRLIVRGLPPSRQVHETAPWAFVARYQAKPFVPDLLWAA